MGKTPQRYPTTDLVFSNKDREISIDLSVSPLHNVMYV